MDTTNMRKVKVFVNHKKHLVGIGRFHLWGTRVNSYALKKEKMIYAETVAIVEMEDGTILEVYPDCIEFVVDKQSDVAFVDIKDLQEAPQLQEVTSEADVNE